MKRNKLKKLPSRPGTHVSLSKKSCLRQKSRVISQAASNKDFDALLRLGQSPGGFVSDRLRRIIWPLLLGLEDQQLPWSVEVSGQSERVFMCLSLF